MIKKTIQRSEDCYIQFTKEELATLGISEGDKFSWEAQGDSILLKKFVPVEIDFSEWTKENLLFLIETSIEKNLSIEDVIIESLEQITSKLE